MINNKDNIFSNAKKITVIMIVVYVVLKQAFYFAFIDSEAWLARTIANVVILLLVLLIVSNKKLSRRQMSWLVPVAISLAEITYALLTGGYQLIFITLVGCALFSLLYVDTYGLAVTTLLNTAVTTICLFVFDIHLLGESTSFENNVYHFAAMVIAFAFIFAIGKYIMEAVVESRKETEAAQLEITKILTEKAYHDALTGVYNRRFLDETLDRMLKSLSRAVGTFSLLMIDIDFFKNYNDEYGHSEGDKCLKLVAEVISTCATRINDFAARYGGDEFAVVLANTDEDGARIVAEKILQRVRNLNIPHAKSDAAEYVTISIGVITGQPKCTQSAEDFIKRADEMLYKSKHSGRDIYTYDEYIDESIDD